MTAIIVKLFVIVLAVLATVAIMVLLLHWSHRTVWPGAITSGVLTAVLMILGHTGRL